MKNQTIAMAVMAMVLMVAGNVAADMVDIGTGQMERTEFEALKALVQRQPVAGNQGIATPLAHTEQYGLLAMTPADFEDLRHKVAGIETSRASSPTVQVATRMVDIGTGEMPADEFAALKRMVRKSGRIVFDKLATLHP